MTVGCNLLGTTAVACSESIWGSGADYPGATTLTFSGDMKTLGGMPVVVTTGLPAATTGASPSANTAAATAATSGFATSTAAGTASDKASVGASSSATPSGTASPASSSGGVAPQVTGNAHWVIGGVAAALALAAV